jgi:polysaccharide deacetylase 2 family uncharacterized protein YibQ
VKAKAAKPARPKGQKPRKKLRFEDGVRAALIASAVICAVVLGAGGFFALRSALTGGQSGPSLDGEGAGTADGGPAQTGTEPPPPENPPSISGAPEAGGPAPDILPEVEQIIRDLEAATGAPGTPDTAAQQSAADSTAGTTAAPPAAVPARPTAPAGAAPAAVSSAQGASAIRRSDTPAGRKGILVLVIDDAGNNLRELEPFLAFPGPLTIAVLPGLPNSVEAARRVRASGKELFLHQPMEPLNGQDPGPGAVKTGMSPAQVKEIIVKNLTEIGPVTGFNNHEGSRATMDRAIMRPVLEISRDSALVFLDSRTTADTAAPALARELGLAIAQRDTFLDNEQDRASILAALEAGAKKAEQNGAAILIGHAWSPRLAAILTEMYPRLIKEGFFFTTVSGLMQRGK